MLIQYQMINGTLQEDVFTWHGAKQTNGTLQEDVFTWHGAKQTNSTLQEDVFTWHGAKQTNGTLQEDVFTWHGAKQTNGTLQEDVFTWHGAELAFITIMMVTGIIGNVLVFYIYHFRWQSNTVTIIKRMLAVLDLASLLLVHPALLYMIINPGSSIFKATCVFTSLVALGTAIASSCVLVIIAVDRFMRLCLLRQKGLQTNLSMKLCVASVLIGCILNIPCGWAFDRSTVFIQEYNIQISECFISNGTQATTMMVYSSLLGVIFIIICTSLCILYYKIVKTLQQLSHKHNHLMYTASLTRRLEAQRQQTQSDVMKNSAVAFIVVTAVFFASYFPYFITLVLSMTQMTFHIFKNPVLKAIFDLAKFSPLVNNMANPIIYSFTSKHFREEVKKTLTFKSCNREFFKRRMCSFTCNSQTMSSSSIGREV